MRYRQKALSKTLFPNKKTMFSEQKAMLPFPWLGAVLHLMVKVTEPEDRRTIGLQGQLEAL